MDGSGCSQLTIECTPSRILFELDIVIEVDFDGRMKEGAQQLQHQEEETQQE
jgi:hypothetical protein